MRILARTILIVLSVVPAACARGDFATLTIRYHGRSEADQWNVEPPARQRIGAALKRAAETQGYKCNGHGKRTEEVSCVGPKRMNVTFQPELNRPEFTVRFNWVEWHGRTRDEFEQHVRTFAAAMTRAVPDAEVQVIDGRS